MTEALRALIDAAKQIEATPEHREAQRRSFAYGNTHFGNQLITREMIDEQAEKIAWLAKQQVTSASAAAKIS